MIYPGREFGVAAKRCDTPVDIDKYFLGYFLCIFPVEEETVTNVCYFVFIYLEQYFEGGGIAVFQAVYEGLFVGSVLHRFILKEMLMNVNPLAGGSSCGKKIKKCKCILKFSS